MQDYTYEGMGRVGGGPKGFSIVRLFFSAKMTGQMIGIDLKKYIMNDEKYPQQFSFSSVPKTGTFILVDSEQIRDAVCSAFSTINERRSFIIKKFQF